MLLIGMNMIGNMMIGMIGNMINTRVGKTYVYFYIVVRSSVVAEGNTYIIQGLLLIFSHTADTLRFYFRIITITI